MLKSSLNFSYLKRRHRCNSAVDKEVRSIQLKKKNKECLTKSWQLPSYCFRTTAMSLTVYTMIMRTSSLPTWVPKTWKTRSTWNSTLLTKETKILMKVHFKDLLYTNRPTKGYWWRDGHGTLFPIYILWWLKQRIVKTVGCSIDIMSSVVRSESMFLIMIFSFLSSASHSLVWIGVSDPLAVPLAVKQDVLPPWV